ncbi:N-(5'-phosphoribosyl)anthranilate isomerase [Anaerobiospirillum thomasii]|uniref:phosphoribosylanthranilate isomerase n=1 Tax=Anaerobiospirillum thomasii TaxID=179995 RepID=UPI000D83AE73|nr:phosphoribosylanthranilate isomerase [Anaerobiospirillum thomasii]SPT67843.1 N-(5'-phosphoribosyl)anthranilate isomerase [Anaerobiospirillum thomasii]
MIKIKFCGLSRLCDIEAVNEMSPEYIGFVFTGKSSRYVSEQKASQLKSLLSRHIKAVGVFVDAEPRYIADLIHAGIIDMVQLHGNEDNAYIDNLRLLTDKPIIKAFEVKTCTDIETVNHSSADYVLLDSGKGSGVVFDWKLIDKVNRSYFLAGGLNVCNVQDAVKNLHPFAVDVSSGIETDGVKDKAKMMEFIKAVRSGK